MTIENRSLEETLQLVRENFKTRIPNSNAWIKPNNLWIAATVIGGLIWEIYQRVKQMPDQTLPDTAIGIWLERWGNVYNVKKQHNTKASGVINVTGEDGTIIAAGISFSDNNNHEYISTLDSTISSGTAQISVVAVADGYDSNQAAGAFMQPGVVLVGLDQESYVDSNGITGGADVENDDNLRERILHKIRTNNQYGTQDSYVTWSKQVAGVTRAWLTADTPYINIYFMMDNSYTDGIPQAGDANTVYDYLNDECRKPIGALVNVFALDPVVLNISIECIAPNGPLKATIIAEINKYIIATSEPGKPYTTEELMSVLATIPGMPDYNIVDSFWDVDPDQIAVINPVITYV